MVLDLLIHKLWNVITTNIKQTDPSNNTVTQKKIDTVSFPQGSQFLDYRENKNLRGLPYLSMSEGEHFDKLQYKNEINNKKKILNQTSNETMMRNQELIEGFVTRGVIDGDYEYYKRASENIRNRQISERMRFHCLTGKDTCLSESNVFQAKNISYNQYTQPETSKLQPWELQTMRIKTTPDILYDMDLLNQKDRDILNNQ